jgi:hypothetical protein
VEDNRIRVCISQTNDAPVNRDYVWHPVGEIWQAPGVGEQWMRDLNNEFVPTLRDQRGCLQILREVAFANASTEEIAQNSGLDRGFGERQQDLSPTLDDKDGFVVDTIRFTGLR